MSTVWADQTSLYVSVLCVSLFVKSLLRTPQRDRAVVVMLEVSILNRLVCRNAEGGVPPPWQDNFYKSRILTNRLPCLTYEAFKTVGLDKELAVKVARNPRHIISPL